MSRTMQKNGKRVEGAMRKLTGEGRGSAWEKVTTARVAETAGVTKPTAAKYLLIMRDYGMVARHVFDGRTVLWSWVGEGN